MRGLDLASSSCNLAVMLVISMIASDGEDLPGALHYEDLVQALRVIGNGGTTASLS